MVLAIISDTLGSSNCIFVGAKYHIRRKVRLGEDSVELVSEDNSTEAPAYDTRIMEMHRDDAEFGPGVNRRARDDIDDGAPNKSFVTAL